MGQWFITLNYFPKASHSLDQRSLHFFQFLGQSLNKLLPQQLLTNDISFYPRKASILGFSTALVRKARNLLTSGIPAPASNSLSFKCGCSVLIWIYCVDFLLVQSPIKVYQFSHMGNSNTTYHTFPSY